MRLLVPALAATLTALPALAAQPPSIVPTRDFSGTYQVTSPSNPTPQIFSVEYSAALQSVRFDNPDKQGYVIYDAATKDAKLVMPQMQRYMDQPMVTGRMQEMQNGGGTDGDNISVSADGTRVVAGQSCANTKITDNTKGTWSEICTTSDNVLLAVDSSDGSHVVAQNISYTPVPAADLTVPAGYTQFVIPQMPAGMQGMGGMSGMSMPNMQGMGQ
jgi:hypothetical protein